MKASKIQLINYPKKYKEIGISKIFNGTRKAMQNESRIKGVNAFNWRIYAKKELPEIYNEREHESFYLFIFEFLMAIDDAYERQNFKFIKRIFKFVNKCSISKSYYVSNAVNVSFYGHIADHPNLEKNLKLISKGTIKNVVIPLTRLVHSKNYQKLLSTIRKTE